ncbi:rhodanese-like domain-containing protein [Porticoccus sp. W117]|uniref:rhodanese-like domain-containing protein n=1 Tax=Porticoccus sp. W117 TaxID=3054777 RepID=UPI0025945BB4|nr:rhodanese-like domain-containing protein [Porticoccus sp. W117]MDM3872164.1 rhodanese-like domain-containing protein [Porticoccus sp. W117]
MHQQTMTQQTMTQQTISAQQFQQQFNSANDTLIDVRAAAEYREIHLVDATNLPLDQITGEQAATHNSERCYLICKAGKRAAMAAEKIAASYPGELIVVEGGTDACVELGMDCQRDKGVMSLERQVRIAAGALVLLGVVLSLTVHSGFIALSAFVGAGLVFAGITDTCGMGLLLTKMPWNR